MSMIYVRAKVGRVARTSPKGPIIPVDRYIPVRETPYINRLLRVHGDIELQPKTTPKPKDAPAPEAKEGSK